MSFGYPVYGDFKGGVVVIGPSPVTVENGNFVRNLPTHGKSRRIFTTGNGLVIPTRYTAKYNTMGSGRAYKSVFSD